MLTSLPPPLWVLACFFLSATVSLDKDYLISNRFCPFAQPKIRPEKPHASSRSTTHTNHPFLPSLFSTSFLFSRSKSRNPLSSQSAWLIPSLNLLYLMLSVACSSANFLLFSPEEYQGTPHFNFSYYRDSFSGPVSFFFPAPSTSFSSNQTPTEFRRLRDSIITVQFSRAFFLSFSLVSPNLLATESFFLPLPRNPGLEGCIVDFSPFHRPRTRLFFLPGFCSPLVTPATLFASLRNMANPPLPPFRLGGPVWSEE